MSIPQASNGLMAQKGSLVEAGCWLVGISMLACMDPAGEHLFSLCPFSWVLEKGCPGCGLGHSIAFLFRGEWVASWQAHPMGIPALLILGGRIVSLLRQYRSLKNYQLTYNNHG